MSTRGGWGEVEGEREIGLGSGREVGLRVGIEVGLVESEVGMEVDSEVGVEVGSEIGSGRTGLTGVDGGDRAKRRVGVNA